MEKPCGALWGMVAKHRIPTRIEAPSGSQFLLKGLCGACVRNTETLAGFKRKGWSVRPLTGGRNIVGNGCEKAERHLNPSLKPRVRNRAARCRRQKHEVVGYGCEKAEHHLNPSLRRGWRCRNCSFETVKIHSTQVKTSKWTVAGI